MPSPNIAARLQQLADRQVAKNHVRNFAVGIQSADGHIAAAAAAGHADAAGAIAMTIATPYHLASITKMYTAVVVIKLAESGGLDLNSPIAAYLGAELVEGIHVIDGTDRGAQITVCQLLDQTSGLADYFDGKPKGGVSLVDNLKAGRDRALSAEDIVEIVRRLRPMFAPGAAGGRKAHYSDTNYALLGAIIEATTAATVADNFQEMIFGPLGLADTYVFDHTRPQPPPAAIWVKDRVLSIPLAMSSFSPDGAVVSTAADSLRFLRAFFGGELLTPDQLAFMTRRWNRIFFPLQYGSGLMRFRPPRWMSPFKAPPELIGHSGSTGSFAFHDLRRDVYLAGTLNQMDKPSRPYRIMTQMIGLLY
ncbi:MAG: beta-lactamase family protein [Acidimicrobiia bacterium]|nr:beta-lactamase family protein [Acidimicrobiia bacterium]